MTPFIKFYFSPSIFSAYQQKNTCSFTFISKKIMNGTSFSVIHDYAEESYGQLTMSPSTLFYNNIEQAIL